MPEIISYKNVNKKKCKKNLYFLKEKRVFSFSFFFKN
jgi:hypothetical protein